MRQAPDLLERARQRAGLVLWIEQLWPALLPALFLLGAFVLLSLLTLPQRLPFVLRLVLVLLLAAVCWRLVRRGVHSLRSPAIARRDRRIERASRLAHRPLSTLADRPAYHPAYPPALAGGSDALWHAHQARTRARLGALSAGLPRLGWRGHDRLFLGRSLLLLLGLTLLCAGTQAPTRILSGFWPWADLPLGPRPGLQAWITPPSFTGGAPVFLSDPHALVSVPAGSTLSISLLGSAATPRLSGAAGHFRHLSDRSWSLDTVLAATGTDGARIVVRQSGYALADWRVVAEPSPPPSVSWTTPPGADKQVPWRLRLPWTVSQRYGVRALAVEIRLADGSARTRVLRLAVPLPGTPSKAHGTAMEDLSADPWAGTKVSAVLVATDSSGREARSTAASFLLPTRAFRNPLARAVLDIRRRLATGADSARAAADELAALGDTPGPFARDSGLFLNLSATGSLLGEAGEDNGQTTPGVVQEAIDRLWSLAQALEDGLHNDRAGARANAEVRRAQDRVARQIEHMRQLGQNGQTDAEQEELKRRVADLAKAIRQKMQALAAQAAREHKLPPPMPEALTQGGDALAQMMQQMQQMQKEAQSGQAEQAMQNLQRMQQMLDHMRLATPRDLAGAAQQAEATKAARDQMQAVQDLVQRQTGLLDTTQNREDASERARQDAEQRLQTDDEDASSNDANAAPDPATRALLQQLGIPLEENGAPDGRDTQQQPPPAPQAAQPTQDRDAAREHDQHAQGVLSRAVNELAQEFTALTGKKAEQLGEAEKQMRAARDALAAKRDGDAASAETKALAALEKGRNQMSAAMRGGRSGGSGLALLPGDGSGREDGADGGGDDPGDTQMDAGDDGDGEPGDAAEFGSKEKGPRDPLGRPAGDGNGARDDGDETHVPNGDQAARSRQIEQELRRRDSDRTRPQHELDYLDRLLKAF